MDGVPLASPEPAARPSFSRLEITVPEPSLVSEWNSEDLHEFHSSSKNHQNESEIPEPPTHLREKRFVPNRPRRSEPTPLRPMNHNPQPPERGYFQSVEPGPNQTMPSGSGSGTLELIEVIRSQELEIHRQKKFNEKQYRQLTQQAQLIQSLKDEVEKTKKSESKNSFTQTEIKTACDSFTQSDPKPSKRTRDSVSQTEHWIPEENQEKSTVLNHNFSRRSSTSTPPMSNTSDSVNNSIQSVNNSIQSVNNSIPSVNTPMSVNNSGQSDKISECLSDDDESESENELPEEELAKLVADILPQSAKSPPRVNLSQDVSRSLNNSHQTATPTDSVFIRNIAPSYGTKKVLESHVSYGEESICEQLAKKYGISGAGKIDRNRTRSSPDETFQGSADMSLATAQYLERHSIGRYRNRRPPPTGHSRTDRYKHNTRPIVDFSELEKLQNFK